MIKELLAKLKKSKNAEEYHSLNAQMVDLLSDVNTIEQLKEVCAKDGMELTDEGAERVFEKLMHLRQTRKVVLDADELVLVNGGAADWLLYPAVGPDEWVKEGEVYRYNNTLYKRGYSVFRLKELDGCYDTEDGFCFYSDSCYAAHWIYNEIYNGDERTDIDPARMSDAFINGVITGGEDF